MQLITICSRIIYAFIVFVLILSILCSWSGSLVSGATIIAYGNTDTTCQPNSLGHTSSAADGQCMTFTLSNSPSYYTLTCNNQNMANFTYYTDSSCQSELASGNGQGDGETCFAVYTFGTHTQQIFANAQVNCNAAIPNIFNPYYYYYYMLIMIVLLTIISLYQI